jgi:hypothetical protein
MNLQTVLANPSILWYNAEAKGILKKAAEHFDKIARNMPPAIKTLANHGWYLPFDSLPEELFNYTKALDEGRIELVNDELVLRFEGNLSDIITRACTSFPNRAEMLMEAKLAHEAKMYFASTSLFLSNADGILNGKLYKPIGLKKELENREISIEEFTRFLTEENSITRKYSAKNNDQSDSLNRHGVLHGTDVKYGTKVNSFKALSLLDYVVVFIVRYEGLNKRFGEILRKLTLK